MIVEKYKQGDPASFRWDVYQNKTKKRLCILDLLLLFLVIFGVRRGSDVGLCNEPRSIKS